ncbi:hypothetical protein FK531_18505 [Rhodococcus spelaei]|uniref:Beta-glucuronidase C-terminal domain-containing protein n=1 Tax=Rhodococcus spelaei TaxID=2546320 RepID=A0A541B2G1_9NOCA|nr:glycosyl hydrolase family 79 C-terminal domain-containing protein [Rhodococcus spelaei]TQF66485.1 hypothetical protein FK531_18505 [Rhodococcus spelaei]
MSTTGRVSCSRFRPSRTAVVLITAAVPVALTTIPASAQSPNSVTVVVDTTAPGRTVPADFLGLSFEANLMHEQWLAPGAGNVSKLIANLGHGNLRFSANQVDNTAWTPDPSSPLPAWAKGQRVTPDDLSRVGNLARDTGWSVDMGVNLAHFDPAAAADQARAAEDRIGSALRSVQIGNEPNFYVLASVTGGGQRKPYLPASYADDAHKYRDAIAAAAPGVAVEGPDTAAGGTGSPLAEAGMKAALVDPWLDSYIERFGTESRSLNQHYYPFVNTARLGLSGGSSDAVGGQPTVDKLLSQDTSDRQTAFIRSLVSKAEKAGLQPRLTETNSVAKEGLPGVTNSFGGALWTVDYLMTAAREGVTGVNLHLQPNDCESYPVFCFPDDAARAAGQARPNPNYYAALAVSKLVGGQILPTTVDSGGKRVTALAVRMPDGTVKVMVDNLDRGADAAVTVKVKGGSGTASAQRLTGGAPESTIGTTFAGAAVTPDGAFTPAASESVPAVDGAYRLDAGAASAVLLTAPAR